MIWGNIHYGYRTCVCVWGGDISEGGMYGRGCIGREDMRGRDILGEDIYKEGYMWGNLNAWDMSMRWYMGIGCLICNKTWDMVLGDIWYEVIYIIGNMRGMEYVCGVTYGYGVIYRYGWCTSFNDIHYYQYWYTGKGDWPIWVIYDRYIAWGGI